MRVNGILSFLSSCDVCSAVNQWLKIKTEASGWPKECVTEDQKRQYIREYYEKGILLDYNAIRKNPGRKAVAKLMLNRYVDHQTNKLIQRETNHYVSLL